jgi:hypothetical protein
MKPTEMPQVRGRGPSASARPLAIARNRRSTPTGSTRTPPVAPRFSTGLEIQHELVHREDARKRSRPAAPLSRRHLRAASCTAPRRAIQSAAPEVPSADGLPPWGMTSARGPSPILELGIDAFSSSSPGAFRRPPGGSSQRPRPSSKADRSRCSARSVSARWASDPKVLEPASHEVIALPRVSTAGRIGYSVPRPLRGVACARPRGLPTGGLPTVLTECGSSSLELRTFFRGPGWRCSSPIRSRKDRVSPRSASLGLLRPSSVRAPTSRHLAWFHPGAFPLRPFSDPWGLDPREGLWPCCMPLTLMGFLPFRAFPRRPALPGSSPGDTLSTFLAVPVETTPGPQGVLSIRDPFPSPEYCIQWRADALFGFSSLPRLSRPSGWSDVVSVPHPLLALASEPFKLFPDAGLQRLPPEVRGVSRSRERLPP